MMNIITDTDEIIADKSDLVTITSIIEPTLPSHMASKYYADHLIAGSLKFLGLWDASIHNTFPSPMDDQSMYIISNAGTVNGHAYEQGDLTIYLEGFWYWISYNDLITEGISLSAAAPLHMTYSPDTVSVVAATNLVSGILSPTAPQQYFGGRKIFLSLPSIPETPVAATDAASKGYVNTQIALGVGAALLPITYAGGVLTFSPSTNTTTALPFRITNTASGIDMASLWCSKGISIAKSFLVGSNIVLLGTAPILTSIYASSSANTLVLSAVDRVYCSSYARATTPIASNDGANKAYVDAQVAALNDDDTFYASLTTSTSITIPFYTNIATHVGLVQVPVYFSRFNGNMVTVAVPYKSFTAGSTGMLYAAGGSIPSGYRPTTKNIYPIMVQGTSMVWGGIVSFTDGTMQIFKQSDELTFTSGRSYILYGGQTTWLTTVA